MSKFKEIQKECYDLSKRKNNDYGHDNISALGLKGVYVRLWDKVSRLKQLVWLAKEQEVADESIEDTFKDIANYATIALLFMRDQWGTEEVFDNE